MIPEGSSPTFTGEACSWAVRSPVIATADAEARGAAAKAPDSENERQDADRVYGVFSRGVAPVDTPADMFPTSSTV